MLVMRPGGEATVRGQRRVVNVAGYPALEPGMAVVVTVLAVPDAGSYREISLRPAAGQER